MYGYRLYRFGASGHFSSSVVISADSDLKAIQAASELLAGAAGELWLEAKLVARLGAKPTSSSTI